MSQTQSIPQGILADKPVQPWHSFNGYYHKKDASLLPDNVLTYPTLNVLMPDGDKIVPRGGEKRIEQNNAIQNSPIIGHFKKYKNIAGIEMEIRVWNDNSITLTGILGTFVVGDTITGASSGATAQVDSVNGSQIFFSNLVGIFTGGETVNSPSGSGVVSIFKGDVIEVLYQNTFQQITPNLNTLAKGVSRINSTRIYFFDQWIDTNLNPALSINTNRAIWVMGLKKVRSWTGGVALIDSVVLNTSISLPIGITWSSQGFPSPTNGGSNQIVVNGVTYTITGGWDTNTLTLASTSGISAGDTAFSGIQEVSTDVEFDYMSGFKNYPTYGNWFLQKFYMGNNYNRPASQSITQSQAVQNDLVLDNSAYTGTGHHVYRVTIDSIDPPVEEQTFYGNGLNDSQFNTSGYSNLDGITHVYNINYLADFNLIAATAGGTWTVGETLSQATSLAQGIVVTKFTSGSNTVYGLRMITSYGFDIANAVTGSSSGFTHVPVQALYQDFVQYSKDNVVININTGSGSMPIAPINTAATLTLSDGLTILFANFQGHTVGDSIQLTINKGGVDTFQWQIDGASPGANVLIPITGLPQVLSQGISITFVHKTGHALGDFWDITVDQNIGGNTNNAYANFYYNTPIRKPGQGYIGQLPANFWTMAPQEDFMYINDASGKWGYVETILSADLQSESISFTPLKQKGRNKVIFPYMIGYLDNNIAYVTEDKNLDFIGRKELVQLPQISHLSDPVKLDFLAASFENGSIEFNSLRLYITSPTDLLMFCYDESQHYWQPPQLFPENGILSEVGLDLISHSSIRNITNTLFVDTNDNGSEFPIRIRTGYNIYGDRWQLDIASMMFLEGYMDGDPKLTCRALLNVNGCLGIVNAIVEPIFCRSSDRAPIGYGTLGSHSLGSDVGSPIPYFQWIGIGQTPFSFYMAALDLECNSKDPIFQILSMGLNTVASRDNNAKLKKGQLLLI